MDSFVHLFIVKGRFTEKVMGIGKQKVLQRYKVLGRIQQRYHSGALCILFMPDMLSLYWSYIKYACAFKVVG